MAYTQCLGPTKARKKEKTTIDCRLDRLVELALSLEVEELLGLGTCASSLERLHVLRVYFTTCSRICFDRLAKPAKHKVKQGQDYSRSVYECAFVFRVPL